jgi:hypothetical protein
MTNQFTITRSTSNGVQEVLTIKGWKSREVIKRDLIEICYFDNTDGSKEVRKWKSDARCPKMKKSIMLNYA